MLNGTCRSMTCLNSMWSGRWESNPRHKLGKLGYYHYTTPAEVAILCAPALRFNLLLRHGGHSWRARASGAPRRPAVLMAIGHYTLPALRAILDVRVVLARRCAVIPEIREYGRRHAISRWQGGGLSCHCADCGGCYSQNDQRRDPIVTFPVTVLCMMRIMARRIILAAMPAGDARAARAGDQDAGHDGGNDFAHDLPLSRLVALYAP